MPERVRYHRGLSFALTVASIALTEVLAHFLGVGETVSAGFFLLGLVPVAYGALGAGFLSGMLNTGALAVYVLHYSAPHDVLVDAASWPSAVIVLALGAAMSYPMGLIHEREVRFRAEIRARTSELEHRNAELTEINAALESFGYVVSHDLKEPVRAIENYLSAAQEEWPSSQSKEFVIEAHEANRRLAKMLQGLLEYSRASSAPLSTKPLDVAAIITGEDCRVMYGALFEERGTRLTIEDDLPRVLGDELLLSQLFGNLLLNAARHNPAGKGHVRIRVVESDGLVHLVVQDDGAGYPPEVLQRFGQIPRRGAATVKGGFGLVIAQRAARKLGGNLWLDNAPEGGARAHVELPRADP